MLNKMGLLQVQLFLLLIIIMYYSPITVVFSTQELPFQGDFIILYHDHEPHHEFENNQSSLMIERICLSLGTSISADQRAILPLKWDGNLETVESFYLNPAVSTFGPHLIILLPGTVEYCLFLLEVIAKGFSPRNGRWKPATAFLWPTKISSPNWKSDVHDILNDQVAPLTRNAIDINQSLYIVFELDISKHESFNDGYQKYENVQWTLWEIYFINGYNPNDTTNTVLVIQQINQWQNSKKVSRRGDLRRINLTIVAPNLRETHAELNWKEYPHGLRQLISGSSYDMLKDLEDLMNFRSNIVEGDWISQHENGTLKGVTAELLRSRKVDLMIGQSVPIPVRTKIMDYLQPTTSSALRAFLHQPPASAFHDIYVTPFELNLWLAIFGTLLLILISVKLISWILSRNDSLLNSDRQFCSDSPLWVVGVLTMQGWHKHPKSSSLRSVFITASITGLICYIAYAGEIVSVLSLENVPIRSLKQLFKSSVPVFASDDSITVKEYVKHLEPDVNFKIRTIVGAVGVHRVFQTPSSLITYSHRFHAMRQAQNHSDVLSCKIIYSFPVTRVPLPSAMAVPKKSPLRDYFNHRIIGMNEHGLLNRYRRNALKASGLRCVQFTALNRAELGVHDISTAIVILTSGYLICITLLVLEYMMHKRKMFKLIYNH